MSFPSYQDLLVRKGAPPGSSWGLFGDGDDLGMINLLTPERVLDGVGCVRRGATFNLDLRLDVFDPPVSPSRGKPAHHIFQSNPNHRDEYLDGFYTQGSSQIDGLRHFRNPDHGFYNGHPDDEVREGSPRLGIGRWADHGIVGRGVLLDVGSYLEGTGEPLDLTTAQPFRAEVLDATAAQQGVELRDGDIVLVRTGWLRYVLNDMTHEQRLALPTKMASPGLDQHESTLQWLWDHQVPLVASDNLAVESYPPRADSPFLTSDERDGVRGAHTGMLHRILIPLLGIALGELWDLDSLAADCAEDGTWDFLLVAKPLNLTGGVGSPANAVAIK